MTMIADLLDRDPRGQRLVNNGQARLSDTSEEEDRGELRTFVCEGRYADGITRMLENFCRDIGKTSQQAAWVSGFYGSGKSHLLKMLDYLWANEPFSDGMTPRALVEDMPEIVRAALRELDTQAARAGGLFAAGGSMPSGQTRTAPSLGPGDRSSRRRVPGRLRQGVLLSLARRQGHSR